MVGCLVDQYLYLTAKILLNMFDEIGMLRAKLVDTPMDSNVKVMWGYKESFENFRRLVKKINYFTITTLEISFTVSVIS